ncbi:MAG: PhzF family phenazine biosynthesis protein [candidate division Zixibacteria bacterium]|nr:PhzF family phenazine biosynthesis protein [candidate division Zixibacteria bacterium]
MNKQFYILDVFAEQKYAGNQLAVVMDAADLSDEQMQTIAQEMNYSETTFIRSGMKSDGGYDVRIYTPTEELPLAGHPTLGTAFIIQQEIVKEKVEIVSLNLKAGQIPVTFNYNGNKPGVLWMKHLPPTFGKIFMPEILADVLSIDIGDIETKFPIQEVSTGAAFIIIPLKNLDAVKRSVVSKDKYFNLVESGDSNAIMVFSSETYNEENDINARMFADYYGIPEDPATGSANGCLAAYIVKHRYTGDNEIDLRVEQGYEINRKSLLLLKAKDTGETIDVNVGGSVHLVAKGELL